MKTLKQFLPTFQGWAVRQTVKYLAGLSAVVTVWLTENGFSHDNAAAVWTGVTALALGIVELIFSRIAAKLKEE